jgi:2-oxoglutarate ferredoxin oxidoreductase subunit beta
MKRTNPDKIIFSYQGDGDLAAIGTGEIIHAAHRGERITVIFINNAIFGMTGGQMAPTTLVGQVTATTPQGREVASTGFPLQISEMLAILPGAIYVERCGLHNPAQVRKAKQAVRHAFELQVNNAPGLSLVELLSPCPTGWRMSPKDALKWVEDEMMKVFPLGKLKDYENKK